MGFRKRVDSTQAPIVSALRACGWTVELTDGWHVDAIAHRRGEIRLLEFKAKGGKPTKSQQRLVAQGFPIVFLKSVEEAVSLDSCARDCKQRT